MKRLKITEQRKQLRSKGWIETRTPLDWLVAGTIHTRERIVVLYRDNLTNTQRFYVKKRSNK